MLNNIKQFFKRFKKSEKEESKSTAKERLHLVLAQDRANISADFLEMMKQEILEVIKKYIDIDEKAIDVRLTNKEGEDGKIGAPALYANIPIITIKNDARKLEGTIKNDKEKVSETQKTEEIDQNIQQTQIESNNDKKKKKNNKEISEDVVDSKNDSNNVANNEQTSINENKSENIDEVDNEKKNP